MRIRRLRLVNYRRHRDMEIEFPDGVIAIVGRNGSGKTSLLEAIAFALYGTQATRTAKAMLRSDQAAKGDALRVELDAEVAGQAMSVVRELRGANQTGLASLVIDGNTIVAPQTGSFDAVTAEVAQRIGLDRDTFFTTVFAQQKDLARLGDKSKAERKKLVLGMLGIDALDRAIQEARTLRRAREARVEALQEQSLGLDEAKAGEAEAAAKVELSAKAEAEAAQTWQASQKALAETTQRHDALAAKAEASREAERAAQAAKKEAEHLQRRARGLQQRIEEAKAAATEIEQHRKLAAGLPELKRRHEEALRQQAAAVQRAKLEARKQELSAKLATPAPDAPNGLLEKARADVETATKTQQESREHAAVLAAQARGVKDRLRRLAGVGDACPVCERPMEGLDLRGHLQQELAQHEGALQQAQVAEAQAVQAVAVATKAQGEAQQAARAHEAAVADRKRTEQDLQECVASLAAMGAVGDADPESIRPALQAAEAAHQAMLRLEKTASQVVPLSEEARHVQKQAQEAEAALAAGTTAQAEVGHDPHALAVATSALKEATAAERTKERAVLDAKQASALAAVEHQQAKNRVEAAQKAHERLKEAQVELRLYGTLAGPRGGLLDRFRSHLVGRIGPAVAAEASRLLSRFTNGRYQEVLLDEDYELYVTEDGVPYHLDRFSGGESDLVHLALRLAVSRLLLERSGTEIRFLALDEVFGSLDDERRRLVLASLQELGTLYSQVFLVTHHDDMREALDHTLLVEETEDGAVVRMHNV